MSYGQESLLSRINRLDQVTRDSDFDRFEKALKNLDEFAKAIRFFRDKLNARPEWLEAYQRLAGGSDQRETGGRVQENPDLGSAPEEDRPGEAGELREQPT
ncbi:hypothetical protein K438DRAFT_1960203 [Mycena galopus ATCC 62051]|nr:hypothetical protein K438DRAFT_1960203 [Mycena galopus ATCC 62051]